MAGESAALLLLLVVSAFTPPLLFLGLVRRTERYRQEPWGRILRTFSWGAVFAVIIAVLLSVLLFAVFQEFDRVYVFSGRSPSLQTLILALLIAPFTEEFAKGIGVYLARPFIKESEDGFVYGAAAGFGFAASENLVYGLAALIAGGLGLSLLVIGVRSVSSALLHASTTATFGYGIAMQRLSSTPFRAWPYYLLAVAIHSAYNLLASIGEIPEFQLGESGALLGLLGAIGLAIGAFVVMREKIRSADDRRVAG